MHRTDYETRKRQLLMLGVNDRSALTSLYLRRLASPQANQPINAPIHEMIRLILAQEFPRVDPSHNARPRLTESPSATAVALAWPSFRLQCAALMDGLRRIGRPVD